MMRNLGIGLLMLGLLLSGIDGIRGRVRGDEKLRDGIAAPTTPGGVHIQEWVPIPPSDKECKSATC